MAIPLRALVMLALLAAGCVRKDNPNYCPGRNADNNCAEGDAGITSCTDNAQCSAPAAICDTVQVHACVQCTPTQASACMKATPVCGADERCRGCRSHAECPLSNVCLPEGSCADPGDVAYVTAPPAGTDNPMCTMAMPCTQIKKALDTRRPYLKLHGSFDEAVMINDRSVSVLADPATVLTRTTMGNILTIDGTSNVKIYDLEISGASGNGAGVSLPGGGSQTVTLSHVSMTRNNGTSGAVSVAGGTINIDRSRIASNTSGGISITSAQFDLENNFIIGNGSDGVTTGTGYGGVSLNGTNTGTRVLGFNTIAGNKGGLDAVTGVVCSLVTVDLTASNNIIYGNTATGLGAQVGGNHCLWSFSDIGPQASGTNLNTDPGFVPGDHHLSAGSPLINQADPAATQPHDIDGDDRPEDGRRDIGADEYVPAK
jgi:hypothetical protein